MSGDREDLQELLVELEYGELDATDRAAAQARIDEHPELVRMQAAFRAVRENLSAWDEVEGQPARIAFVTMPGDVRPGSINTFGWMKGAAIAASFVLGILLAAAFASTNLTRTDTGWTLSTGLSRSGVSAPVSQPSATTSVGTPPVGQIPAGQTPVGQTAIGRVAGGRATGGGVTGGQARPFRMSTSQFGIEPMLVEVPGDRELQLRILVRQMVAAAEQRHQQQTDSLLTDLYQTFDTQRTSDLSVVFDELGLLRSSTGLELQRTNQVIDFLVTRIGSDIEAQVPEQRDD